MHILTEWQIKDWINAAVHGKAESHEINSLRNDVDRLEHSLREVRAENDGLRGRCEELEARVRTLQCQVT